MRELHAEEVQDQGQAEQAAFQGQQGEVGERTVRQRVEQLRLDELIEQDRSLMVHMRWREGAAGEEGEQQQPEGNQGSWREVRTMGQRAEEAEKTQEWE